MLVFTGFRLASPSVFVHTYKQGREQLVIFVSTILGVLATDLLVGIGIGILVKVLLHLINGAPPVSMLLLKADVADREGGAVVNVSRSAVFSTWISLKRRLESLRDRPTVTVNLSDTRLVDHTVMGHLHETKKEFAKDGCDLTIEGLEGHRALSEDPMAARVKRPR